MHNLEIRLYGELNGLVPSGQECQEAIEGVLAQTNSTMTMQQVEVRSSWMPDMTQPDVEENDCQHCTIPIIQVQPSGEWVHVMAPPPPGHFAELATAEGEFADPMEQVEA